MKDADQRGQLWAWAFGSALAVGFIAVLWWAGRPGWCKYGLGLWTGAWSHCTSQNFFDPYSFTHGLHGIIFFWALKLIWPRAEMRWRLLGAIALEMGWELLENSAWVIERYRQQTASLDYVGDSILNSVGDVLSTIAGFYLASRISWKAAIGVFVVIEVVLLITVTG